MEKLKTYQESLAFFREFAMKSDQYHLKINGTKIPNKMHTLVSEELTSEIKILDRITNQSQVVAKPEAISRFSPNNINNKEFWKLSKKYFRLLSVCGSPARNIKEANGNTLRFSDFLGLSKFLLANVKPTDKVLEIGFGYGNIFQLLDDKCQYYGIDYTKPKFLDKYNNLIEIEESGIPETLYLSDNYDYIYSVNVLQHCSKNDRLKYFTQASHCLKQGGHFIFTEFIMTDENKNMPCWGVIDETGRGYTHFFNQLTECDYYEELEEICYSLGFEIMVSKISFGNNLACIIKKI